jgi:homoserine dehydrogenase
LSSIDVPVSLLGYGTVGASVNRLLTEQADDIERATGHRLRVAKALVRDVGKERDYPAAPGVLTDDVSQILDDPSIQLVAEVMGGVEPAGGYVLDLLRRGKHVVTANKQLVARRGAELFSAASSAGVQLRFEASVRRDPRDQGAARGARRDERASCARHRQRHDQLPAHRDGGGEDLRRSAW